MVTYLQALEKHILVQSGALSAKLLHRQLDLVFLRRHHKTVCTPVKSNRTSDRSKLCVHTPVQRSLFSLHMLHNKLRGRLWRCRALGANSKRVSLPTACIARINFLHTCCKRQDLQSTQENGPLLRINGWPNSLRKRISAFGQICIFVFEKPTQPKSNIFPRGRR